MQRIGFNLVSQTANDSLNSHRLPLDTWKHTDPKHINTVWGLKTPTDQQTAEAINLIYSGENTKKYENWLP